MKTSLCAGSFNSSSFSYRGNDLCEGKFSIKKHPTKKNLSKSTVFITVPSKLSKEISLFEKREDLKINSHR